MANYAEIKKEFNELLELVSGMVKSLGSGFEEMTQEEIEKGFRAEFMTYSAAIAMCDGDLDANEVDMLEDVFDIRATYSDIRQLAEAYLDKASEGDTVPVMFKLAVTIDNMVADNPNVPFSLCYKVFSMYKDIAAAMGAADDAFSRNELLVIAQFTLNLRQFADDNLDARIMRKWEDDDE